LGDAIVPLDVTFVTAPRCHFCAHGREVLDALGTRYEMRVREVALTSPEGRAAAERWRVPYPPLVIFDGDLVAYGRVSARKLEKVVAKKVSVVAAPDAETSEP
jgi:hypothetical protein